MALGFSHALILGEKDSKKSIYSWGKSDVGAHGHIVRFTSV